MKTLIIGVDLDGVCANFNMSYLRVLAQTTGRSLVPLDYMPQQWDYATTIGYTEDEDNYAWKVIKSDPHFWSGLDPLPGAVHALVKLSQLASLGHEVYFITSRPGNKVHAQSVQWLEDFGFKRPSVLIDRGGKGPIAVGLGLTHFVDDRPENCFHVWNQTPRIGTKIYMPRKGYNQGMQREVEKMDDEVRRWFLVDGVSEFVTEVMNDAV